MQKRVLFIITKSVWGGAQRYVYDLASQLPKDKFSVSVALGGSGPLVDKLHQAGIRTISIPHLERDINFVKELFSFFSIWKIIRRECPDVVHLNSSKVGGLGALASYLTQKSTSSDLKTIFTVHGWAFNENRNFISKSAIYFLQWLTALFSDQIIIISRHDYRQAIQMPLIPNEKFVLIPLGVPAEKLNFLNKKEAKEKLFKIVGLKSENKSILVGTIAELTRNKGLTYLVDAAGRIKSELSNIDFKCIIIGGGEDKENLEEQIKNLGLKDDILLAGFVDNALQYIKAFDIFTLPSIKEGLPYTLIEAMHAGVAIIASSVGGIPDLIEHEKSGILVPTKNTAALAKAIAQLSEDENLRNQYGERNKEIVSQKFSFEEMLNKTIDLYNK